jgi:hypothetical protein
MQGQVLTVRIGAGPEGFRSGVIGNQRLHQRNISFDGEAVDPKM